MIPPIIHQIWIQGIDKLPDHLKVLHDKCKVVNNNFKHEFWDEPKILALLNIYGTHYVDTYNAYTIWAQKADFARYCILNIHGGIYLDMDMDCRKNLSPFLSYKLFFTTDSMFIFSKRYLNGIIGVVPNHPVFGYIFANLFERVNYRKNVTYSTGTKLFYDSVQQYIDKSGDNDITVVDSKYLHPCGIFSNDKCKYKCNDCYVIHMNNSSWSPFIRVVQYSVKNMWLIIIIIFITIIVVTIILAGR